MASVHYPEEDRTDRSMCRFIRNAIVTTDPDKVTCLTCIKMLNNIPHTTSLIKQTKMVFVPLNCNRERPLRSMS